MAELDLAAFDAVIEWTPADEARPAVELREISTTLSERGQRVLQGNAKLRGLCDESINGFPSDSERANSIAWHAGRLGLSKEDAARLIADLYARPGKKQLHIAKLRLTLRAWAKGREEATAHEMEPPQGDQEPGANIPEEPAPKAKKTAEAVRCFEVLPGPEYMRTSFAGADRLVPGIGLTACGVGVLSGAGGDGKSILALSLVLGWTADPASLPDPLRPARPLRVMLFMVEDAPGMVQERLHMMLGSEPAPDRLLLFTRREPMQFGGSKGRPLTKALDRLAATLARHAPVDVVVFDPLVYLHQAEENSASEMMRWLTPLREHCRQAGAALLIVHHAGWAPDGEDARGRGSTAIRAWSDCELSLRAQNKAGRILHRLNLVKCNFAPRWKEALTLQLDAVTLRFEVVDEAGILCAPESLAAWLTEAHGGEWAGKRADLYAAIREHFGCEERTAREALKRAKDARLLIDEGQRKPLRVVANSTETLL